MDAFLQFFFEAAGGLSSQGLGTLIGAGGLATAYYFLRTKKAPRKSMESADATVADPMTGKGPKPSALSHSDDLASQEQNVQQGELHKAQTENQGANPKTSTARSGTSEASRPGGTTSANRSSSPKVTTTDTSLKTTSASSPASDLKNAETQQPEEVTTTKPLTAVGADSAPTLASQSHKPSSAPTEDGLEKADRSQYKTLHEALSKTREGFWGRMKSRFSGGSVISPSEIEDLEEILYTSDMGPRAVDQLVTALGRKLKESPGSNLDFLQNSLKSELEDIFQPFEGDSKALQFQPNNEPTVWMVVGVNGAGKTTTIGKLASQQVALGKRVLIAAGDTFRAAADAQLKVWAHRAEVEIFSPDNVKDPSAVAFDALKKGQSKNFDIVIIDTAGRLHTQKNLMEELKKMKRVMGKALPGSPHEVLLVLDANSGQNALMQTEQFHKALGLTGVILTKMDGSAKGGVAVGIAFEHQLPIKMIGVGEKIEDLRPFNPKDFVSAIF